MNVVYVNGALLLDSDVVLTERMVEDDGDHSQRTTWQDMIGINNAVLPKCMQSIVVFKYSEEGRLIKRQEKLFDFVPVVSEPEWTYYTLG